jgi:uncharacterized protein
MKFMQEIRPAMNVVTGYVPGAIQLGPRRLEVPVALSAEQVLHPWQAASVAELTFEHFAEMLAWQPEILLLGTGERQQFPAAALMGAMLSRRIGFEVMDSRAACRTYNVLVSESRAVALALL